MKCVSKMFGIFIFLAIISFSMASCDTDIDNLNENSATLKITGLGTRTGYIFAINDYLGAEPPFLGAYISSNEIDMSITGGEILHPNGSSGTVDLNVFSNDYPNGYNGNDKNVVLWVYLKNDPVFKFGIDDFPSLKIGTVSANFTNGQGYGTFIEN